MRLLKAIPLVVGISIFLAMIAPQAKADQWDKKTFVTFDNSVVIPGQVLVPGTYVFKLLDTPSDRNIVQVWTGDEDQLVATILTIPDYQPQARDRSVFVLDSSSGEPSSALLCWFFAGETSGQRFTYPAYPTTE